MSEILDRALAVLPHLTQEQRSIQLKLLIMERATAQAALDLRANFLNENAKSTIITKFFYFYDTLDPLSRIAFRDSVDALGKKYIDAWSFAGIYNFPFRDAIASTYLNSISAKTDKEIQEHIIECNQLENAIKGLQIGENMV